MSSESTAKVAAAIESARDNIALIRKWAQGRDLASLKSDTIVRYAIERAFIAIASAVRDIPEDLLSANSIPAGMIDRRLSQCARAHL